MSNLPPRTYSQSALAELRAAALIRSIPMIHGLLEFDPRRLLEPVSSVGSGEYRVVGGQSIDFGPIASTERACLEPDGIMEQKSQFHAALANTGVWRLVGSNLELRDVDGSLQVSALPAK
jgi:hypothetical protein